MKDTAHRRPPAGPSGSGPGGPGDPDATRAAAELFVAVSAVRRAARQGTRRRSWTEPLPPAQSELLRLAAQMPGLTVAQAARELRLAPNTVSTLIGKLTEQGLLERTQSSTDGRSVLLNITAKARNRLAEWRDLRAELGGPALASLSAADRETLAAAVPALLRLAEQMEAGHA
ncbi:MAG TPA: MarR family transcriptional regulator [Streptosporangiaceae bacterium]